MANPQKGTRFRRARRAPGVIACATALSLAAGLVSPSASGQSSTSAVGELVTAVSRAQANVDELNLGLGDLQENVNQALVDLHDSQARAAQARLGVEEAKKRLEQAQANVEQLKAELDELTRSQYRGAGGADAVSALGSAGSQRDLLDRSLFLKQRTVEKQAKLDEAERARAEAANEESVLREASELAESAAQEAADAEAKARGLLEENRAALEASVAERDAAQHELEAAQSELAERRPEASTQPVDPQEGQEAQEAQEGEAPAENAGSGVVAAPYAGGASGVQVSPEVVREVATKVAEIAPGSSAPDAATIENAVRTAAELASNPDAAAVSSQIGLPQVDPDTIRRAASIAAGVGAVAAVAANHGSFENPFSGSSSSELVTAFADGLSNAVGNNGGLADVLPEIASAVSVTQGAQQSQPGASAQIEAVIARAQSVVGTPYVWGGGDANGPTTGVNGGSLSGFDCSGLVLYAYAAAGIALPHYTGYQYNQGKQVPVSEAKRGDLLFWGPGGSQHVAIYLGDGMMIEAPQTGMNVRVTPVRWSGMTPNAVRLL